MIKFTKYHKDSMYIFACTIAALFGMILMTGCEGETTAIDPRLIDRSFVTNQPCAAPCWYGIEPDKSHETEVLPKLKELPFVNSQLIRENKNVNAGGYPGGSEIQFGYAFPKGSTYYGSIVSVEGIVKDIFLSIQYSLPLKSVIDQLGPPAFLVPASYTPHGDGCQISFVWPPKKVSVIYINPESQQVCNDLKVGKRLSPELIISGVHYMSEDVRLEEGCNPLVCLDWPGLLDK